MGVLSKKSVENCRANSRADGRSAGQEREQQSDNPARVQVIFDSKHRFHLMKSARVRPSRKEMLSSVTFFCRVRWVVI
jgi:hypothetical protein